LGLREQGAPIYAGFPERRTARRLKVSDGTRTATAWTTIRGPESSRIEATIEFPNETAAEPP
jgi:hypothetical protein